MTDIAARIPLEVSPHLLPACCFCVAGCFTFKAYRGDCRGCCKDALLQLQARSATDQAV